MGSNVSCSKFLSGLFSCFGGRLCLLFSLFVSGSLSSKSFIVLFLLFFSFFLQFGFFFLGLFLVFGHLFGGFLFGILSPLFPGSSIILCLLSCLLSIFLSFLSFSNSKLGLVNLLLESFLLGKSLLSFFFSLLSSLGSGSGFFLSGLHFFGGLSFFFL